MSAAVAQRSTRAARIVRVCDRPGVARTHLRQHWRCETPARPSAAHPRRRASHTRNSQSPRSRARPRSDLLNECVGERRPVMKMRYFFVGRLSQAWEQASATAFATSARALRARRARVQACGESLIVLHVREGAARPLATATGLLCVQSCRPAGGRALAKVECRGPARKTHPSGDGSRTRGGSPCRT